MSVSVVFVIGPSPVRKTMAEFHPCAAGYRTAGFASVADALSQDDGDPDLVIIRPGVEAPSQPVELNAVRDRWPRAPIILIAAPHALVDSKVSADLHPCIVRREPVSPSDLRLTIKRAITDRRMRKQAGTLRDTLHREYSFTNLAGRKGSIGNVIEAAAVAARRDLNVLIRGEAGAGKRLLARTIHFSGLRRNGPFVTVYCGVPSPDLQEAEVFGAQGRGSKAGFQRSKVELADGGTLFLDEIGRAPVPFQEKLLRLIEERTLRGRPVNVRIIASARRNLPAMFKDGSFREDLYYRGRFMTVDLPPLRDRLEDMPALVTLFLRRSSEKHHRPAASVPEPLLDRFYHYSWPGNLAELEAAVDHAVAQARSDVVIGADLPEPLQVEQLSVAGLRLRVPYRGIHLIALERELILASLARHNWNQTWAAKSLGLTRKTFLYRMEKHGIPTRAPQTGEQADPRQQPFDGPFHDGQRG